MPSSKPKSTKPNSDDGSKKRNRTQSSRLKEANENDVAEQEAREQKRREKAARQKLRLEIEEEDLLVEHDNESPREARLREKARTLAALSEDLRDQLEHTRELLAAMRQDRDQDAPDPPPIERPEHMSDLTVAEFRELIGLPAKSGNELTDERWLAIRATARDFVAKSRFDMTRSITLQDAGRYGTIVSLRDLVPEIQPCVFNWGAEFLIDGAFSHRREYRQRKARLGMKEIARRARRARRRWQAQQADDGDASAAEEEDAQRKPTVGQLRKAKGRTIIEDDDDDEGGDDEDNDERDDDNEDDDQGEMDSEVEKDRGGKDRGGKDRGGKVERGGRDRVGGQDNGTRRGQGAGKDKSGWGYDGVDVKGKGKGRARTRTRSRSTSVRDDEVDQVGSKEGARKDQRGWGYDRVKAEAEAKAKAKARAKAEVEAEARARSVLALASGDGIDWVGNSTRDDMAPSRWLDEIRASSSRTTKRDIELARLRAKKIVEDRERDLQTKSKPPANKTLKNSGGKHQAKSMVLDDDLADDTMESDQGLEGGRDRERSEEGGYGDNGDNDMGDEDNLECDHGDAPIFDSMLPPPEAEAGPSRWRPPKMTKEVVSSHLAALDALREKLIAKQSLFSSDASEDETECQQGRDVEGEEARQERIAESNLMGELGITQPSKALAELKAAMWAKNPVLAAKLEAENDDDDEPTETYALWQASRRLLKRTKEAQDEDGAPFAKKAKTESRKGEGSNNNDAKASKDEQHNTAEHLAKVKALARTKADAEQMVTDNPAGINHASSPTPMLTRTPTPRLAESCMLASPLNVALAPTSTDATPDTFAKRKPTPSRSASGPALLAITVPPLSAAAAPSSQNEAGPVYIQPGTAPSLSLKEAPPQVSATPQPTHQNSTTNLNQTTLDSHASPDPNSSVENKDTSGEVVKKSQTASGRKPRSKKAPRDVSPYRTRARTAATGSAKISLTPTGN
ncbi:hypothetical protein FRC12_017560 [Ceratobasidium sp. 428]|nr:hypothetical protein FRC12_017560 [Ceratobasidium sp. 428]